jgi:BNR repeat-like domain
MTKIIISFLLIFVSNFSFFNTEKTTSKDITICHETLEEINVSPTDTTLAYTMPLLSKTHKGDVMLSWTEKDAKGITTFCLAFSKDNGKTFSDKKTIFSGTGIGNSRMMRAKVLSEKDGTLVAIFSNREESTGGGRSSNIVYCQSKDDGTTWSSPASVDADPKRGIVRGFFDAAVMANDEIAVVYLKDVANSTKHEERDLRLVATKNGVFQPERVIDPVVCDCCPINLLVDANGALNVIYRDNNDDIRDMAKMISTDNAATFSTPAIIHQDDWKIQGCPHSGAVSSTAGKGVLVAYFSGSEKEKGIRLVSREGKKMLVLDDATAKNPYLVDAKKESMLLWEQTDKNNSKIAYRKINNGKVSEINWIEESANATNTVALSLENQVLVAYEIKNANKRNSLKISRISL